MSGDAEFFRKQANLERANAANATLDNVRDRCDRAASSWEAMAVRAERTQTMRQEREAAPRMMPVVAAAS
jgi:hypothetical protein